MYNSSVFRRKVKGLFQMVAIFKGHLLWMVENIRQKILKRKCIKIQKAVKVYLMEKRMEKYRIAGTKAVTRISAFYRMRKQRRKYLKVRNDAIRLQANIRFFLSMAAFMRYKNCKAIADYLFETGWKEIE